MSLSPFWLTVIMPIHSGESFLHATLDALAAECDMGVEVLFIDSSPNQQSMTIGRCYTERLNIRFMERCDAKQWTDKTNLGVAQARATHVVMLHQDDIWLPGRIQNLRQWITASPDAAVQFAPTAVIAHDGRRVGLWHCPLRAGRIDCDMLIERLIVQNFISVPAPVFRRDAFLAVGGMDSALWYTADWDLWLKLGRVGPVVYNTQVTTAFRVHSKSLTMSGSRERIDFIDQMHIVVMRHAQASGYNDNSNTRAMADASIAINTVLASIASGKMQGLFKAVIMFLKLGPIHMLRYLYYSRLLERVFSRLRAGLL